MSTVWGLIDDRVGHKGQVLGVINRLAIPFVLKRLEYNSLQHLPAVVQGASLIALDKESRARLAPPYPPLVIAAGRRTLPVLRYIKQQSPATRTVYLMRAEVSRDIDLMVVPEHDNVAPAPNIITTLAPLHAVTPAVLEAARREWTPKFADLPKPHIALCMGGDTKRGSYHASQWHELLNYAMAIAAHGSLLITSSRRTPRAAMDMCAPLIHVPHLFHRWDTDKDNPYLGMIACADAIIVTGDSLSMCAEACTAGKPVFIYAAENVASPKHQKLHQALYDRRLAYPLNLGARMDWRPSGALDDVNYVASEIRKRFADVFTSGVSPSLAS